MDLKREQIKKIKADPTLSEQEKSKQIQELMMGKFSFIISNQISNESKTCTHYTKQCYKFYFPCCETWDPCKRCHGERNCSNKDNLQVSKITCSSCETPQDLAEHWTNFQTYSSYNKRFFRSVKVIWAYAMFSFSLSAI